MIFTNDHGHPHVTVFRGTPKSHEAFAKIRLDSLTVLEVKGFSRKDLKIILSKVTQYQQQWMEAWDENQKDQI